MQQTQMVGIGGEGFHLTSALSAVIDGPFVFVLAHNAVVDADATMYANAVLNKLVLICLALWKREKCNNVMGFEII